MGEPVNPCELSFRESSLISGHGGHGSHNSCRHGRFVKWLLDDGKFTNLSGGSLGGGILDVGAGSGELSVRLSFCHNVKSTTVDVRSVSHINSLKKRVIPRLPKKWKERLCGKSDEDLELVCSLPGKMPTAIVGSFNSVEDAEGNRDIIEAVRECSVIIGMHADGATDPVVDVALKYNKVSTAQTEHKTEHKTEQGSYFFYARTQAAPASD